MRGRHKPRQNNHAPPSTTGTSVFTRHSYESPLTPHNKELCKV